MSTTQSGIQFEKNRALEKRLTKQYLRRELSILLNVARHPVHRPLYVAIVSHWYDVRFNEEYIVSLTNKKNKYLEKVEKIFEWSRYHEFTATKLCELLVPSLFPFPDHEMFFKNIKGEFAIHEFNRAITKRALFICDLLVAKSAISEDKFHELRVGFVNIQKSKTSLEIWYDSSVEYYPRIKETILTCLDNTEDKRLVIEAFDQLEKDLNFSIFADRARCSDGRSYVPLPLQDFKIEEASSNDTPSSLRLSF